jgi:uncharacterized sulfatase
MNISDKTLLLPSLTMSLVFGLQQAGAQTERPNIVFFIADDCRRQDLGCYGSADAITPNIDRLASQGLKFNSFFQATAMSSPTRHCLLTGLYPVRSGAYPNHTFIREGVKTLPYYLKNAGYRVALQGKRHIAPDKDFPFEYLGKGSDHVNPGQIEPFIADAVATGQPFFLFVASHDPHSPWTRGNSSLFDPDSLVLPPNLVDTKETREKYAAYLAEINKLDDDVGRVDALIEKYGLADNTIFIFTSEQGYSFPFAKWTCYDAGLQTAFIIRWKGVAGAGGTTDAMCEYVDVTPTILDIAGGKKPDDMDGRSFLSVIKRPGNKFKDYTYSIHTTRGIIDGSDYYGIRSVRDDKYRYILNLTPDATFNCVATKEKDTVWASWMKKAETDDFARQQITRYRQRPKEELYDVQNDPFQMNNLAENPQLAKTLASLRGKLYQWMEQQGDKGQQTEMEALEHQVSALVSGKVDAETNVANRNKTDRRRRSLTSEYGAADTRDPDTRIPDCVKPAIDCWLRDTWVTAGPDGYFYMTGTIARKTKGEPHCWDWNNGIPLWRSSDLKSWENMGLIWTFDKDGTWQQKPFVDKEENMPRLSVNGDTLDNKFRALWAPEIHYIKSLKNWFIVACVNNSAVGQGSFILKSVTGKPEGPYVNIEGNKDKPIFPRIDGSLFEDTDGSVYFVGHNHHIARMKPDMSGFAEELRELQETKYPVEPYIEGASIIKHDGKYFLLQAIWSNRMPDGSETYALKRNNETCHSYDCVIATSDNVYGPYGKRENALTGGGHNILFQDKNGKWQATIFYNPRGSQAKEFKQTCRPALAPMKYENGRFLPDMEGCAEYDSQ